LGPRQRGAFQQAALQGQGANFVGTNPWLANRIQNRVAPGSPQEQRIQNFLGTGQIQRPARTPPNQTPGAFTPQPPAGPQPWNESVPPGTTPQIPGGPPAGGWSGDNAAQQPGLGGGGGGGGLGGMQSRLGAMYGGFSPQMQNVLQARYGGGGGGGGSWSLGAGYQPFSQMSMGGPMGP